MEAVVTVNRRLYHEGDKLLKTILGEDMKITFIAAVTGRFPTERDYYNQDTKKCEVTIDVNDDTDPDNDNYGNFTLVSYEEIKE